MPDVLPTRPIRVASLLPSATESLLEITGGLHHPLVQLVGRSHECDWPPGPHLAAIPVLTGQRTRFESSAQVDAAVRAQLTSGQSLYTLDTGLLARLKPDVILTQDLCQVCSIDLNTVRSVVAAMPPANRPEIVSLNPTTFEAVFDDLLTIGRSVGLESAAPPRRSVCVSASSRAEEFVTPFLDGPAVAFLEWTDPIFIGGHWTPQLIERAGGRHPLNPSAPLAGAGAAQGPIGQSLRAAGKSVRIPEEVLAASRPEALIVCPCGLSLEQAWGETTRLAEKPWWRDLPAVKRGRVAVVDGSQMFNRPGPRLVNALEWLVGWMNDRADVMPSGFPWRAWK